MKSGRRVPRSIPVLIALAAVLAAAVLMIPRGKPWTVMVYMIGNRMETGKGLAGLDIAEMQRALRKDTRLLIMTGNAESRYFSGEECRLYRAGTDKLELIASLPGGMIRPEPLEALLREGLKDADGPAALILWDHGYGVEGMGASEDGRTACLSLKDLTDALGRCRVQDRPLEMIGFDACLMANCETALALCPYAAYMTASQETEPDMGWDYSFLSALKPGTDGERAGAAIVNAYCAMYKKTYRDSPGLRQPYTLSCVRLSGLPALSGAVDGFMTRLLERIGQGGFSEVSRLRPKRGFGQIITNQEYDLIDLADFAAACETEFPEAKRVSEALRACVTSRGGSVESAHGLSIYFPQLAGEKKRAERLRAISDLPIGQGWKSLITAYDGMLSGASDQTAPPRETKAFSAVLSDEQLKDYAGAKYFILCGNDTDGYWNVYSSADCTLEGNTVTAHYGGQALTVPDGERRIPMAAFYILEEDGTAFYRSFAILLAKDDSQRVAMLRMEKSLASGQWELLSAMERAEAGSMMTGRQEIDMNDQKEVWLVNYLYFPGDDTERETVPYFNWETRWLDQNCLEGIRDLKEMPLPRDEGQEYHLQLVVRDTYNRQYTVLFAPV